MRTPKRSIGFTMIELLVVIAIIAILAAILFPIFVKAREKARQTSCMNNQRQIAIAILLYVQNNEETFPSAETVWQDVKLDKGTLQCPSIGDKLPNGYIYNGLIADLSLNEKVADPTGIMPPDIREQLGSYLTMDGIHTGGKPAGTFSNVYYTSGDVDMRHNDMFIASFTDGHVELSRLKPPVLSANLLASNIDPSFTASNAFALKFTNTNGSINYPYLLKDGNRAVELVDSSPNNSGSTFRIYMDASKKLSQRINIAFEKPRGSTPTEFLWTMKVERTRVSSGPVTDSLSVEYINNDGGVNIPRFPMAAVNISSYGTPLVEPLAHDEPGGEEIAEMVSSYNIPGMRFKAVPNGGARSITGIELQVGVRVNTNATPEGIAIDDIAVYEILR